MTTMIENGHAKKVPNSEKLKKGKVWYIPHHGMYHKNKPKKICVVFDSSAKFMGISLHDCLYQGPDLTTV